MGHDWFQACMAEFFYTAMICFVVLNTAESKEHSGKNQYFGLAIGFTLIAAAYSGGTISMGCFNPAVAVAIDVSSAFMGSSGACLTPSSRSLAPASPVGSSS